MGRIQKNIKNMKEEIESYHVPRAIKKAMMTLAKSGYEFSGHGVGMGSEDWSVVKDMSKQNFDDYIHVNFSWDGSKCTSQYSVHFGAQQNVSKIKRPADIVKNVLKIKGRKDLLREIYQPSRKRKKCNISTNHA